MTVERQMADDKDHCGCWWDEQPCCRCGYDGDDDETECPGKPPADDENREGE